MNQTAVREPHNGCFILLGSCTLPQKSINELFIFLCKLRWDTVPEHADLRNELHRRMLRKILLIGIQNSFLNTANLVEIHLFRKTQHCFRHAAHVIIVFQCIDVGLPEAGHHLNVFDTRPYFCTEKAKKSLAAYLMLL